MSPIVIFRFSKICIFLKFVHSLALFWSFLIFSIYHFSKLFSKLYFLLSIFFLFSNYFMFIFFHVLFLLVLFSFFSAFLHIHPCSLIYFCFRFCIFTYFCSFPTFLSRIFFLSFCFYIFALFFLSNLVFHTLFLYLILYFLFVFFDFSFHCFRFCHRQFFRLSFVHILLKFTSFYSFLPGSFFSFSKHNCYLMLILIFLYSNISSKTKTTASYQFCLQANNLINKTTLNCVHIKNMFKERSRSFYYIFSSAFAALGHIVL
jgi:hypothetical protein